MVDCGICEQFFPSHNYYAPLTDHGISMAGKLGQNVPHKTAAWNMYHYDIYDIYIMYTQIDL